MAKRAGRSKQLLYVEFVPVEDGFEFKNYYAGPVQLGYIVPAEKAFYPMIRVLPGEEIVIKSFTTKRRNIRLLREF